MILATSGDRPADARYGQSCRLGRPSTASVCYCRVRSSCSNFAESGRFIDVPVRARNQLFCLRSESPLRSIAAPIGLNSAVLTSRIEGHDERALFPLHSHTLLHQQVSLLRFQFPCGGADPGRRAIPTRCCASWSTFGRRQRLARPDAAKHLFRRRHAVDLQTHQHRQASGLGGRDLSHRQRLRDHPGSQSRHRRCR